jgi:hypothetical protein
MMKRLILNALALVLVVGLAACSTLSDGLSKAFKGKLENSLATSLTGDGAWSLSNWFDMVIFANRLRDEDAAELQRLKRLAAQAEATKAPAGP